MNNNKKEFKCQLGGLDVTLETGRLAKQADGAVLVSAGGTQVLVTVCSAREVKDGQDFFPLTVDYTEKFYAAGRFLGGFMKRETRPTRRETLISRLIDRPLRPLFPEGYMFDTFVQATVLSYDPKCDPEVLAGLGASAALAVSDVPFEGALGACKIGRINNLFILNPTESQWKESDMEIAVAATADAILMVEGEMKLVAEKDFLVALETAHNEIKKFSSVVEQMRKECGKTKRAFTPVTANKSFLDAITTAFSKDARTVLAITPKLERQEGTRALVSKVTAAIKANPAQFSLTAEADFKKEGYKAVEELLYKMMRNDILTEGRRIGGRKLNEVRKIQTETSVLKTPHGSALFTRGETQVLGTVTVGGSDGEQMADVMSGILYDNFYLHYNFPPFSVGEARPNRGTGRRELGHGNLAERALKVVMPPDFSYTTRLVCEVLESNGSSSMGSVCVGSLALMDAGVPIKAPVAGIAMGLIKEGSNYKILTDILGDEDHLGDMDFKVAGTDFGISAIQMDIKIKGLTMEIIADALEQARVGRLHILGEMKKTMTSHREAFKENVPRIEMIKIQKDQIGLLIGPSGKNIKAIQAEYAVTVETNDDGTIKILGSNADSIQKCIAHIDLLLNGPTPGKDYLGKVATIKEYGAFVDIAPGIAGLLHVSELANERVNDVGEYLREGDEITVRVLEVDRMGKIKLSAKVIEPLKKRS